MLTLTFLIVIIYFLCVIYPYRQMPTPFEQCKAIFILIGQELVTAAVLIISQQDAQLQHHELTGSINPDAIEF